MKTHARVLSITGLIMLLLALLLSYQADVNPVVIRDPVFLQTGADITKAFRVPRAGSYNVEIECETTPQSIEESNDLDDALADGLDADARITSNGQIVKVDSDLDHFRVGAGIYSRVLGSFKAVPRTNYNLTLHVDRYGQGISARDHKLAGTWDENLIIPEAAHPKLKIEMDPVIRETDGELILLAGGSSLICLIAASIVWFSARRRAAAA